MISKYLSLLFLILLVTANISAQVTNTDKRIDIKSENYAISIIKNGFRYSISDKHGEKILGANSVSGLAFLGSNAQTSNLVFDSSDSVAIEVENALDVKATVGFKLYEHHFKMTVTLANPDMEGNILLRTRGAKHAYGLGEHAGYQSNPSADVSGYVEDEFGAYSGERWPRLVSNFIISPADQIAFINMEPSKKIIKISEKQWAQGSVHENAINAFYYFIGEPKQIYSDFLAARNKEGYKVYPPKYEWFGVGWEAFGALGYNTNHKTVRDNVDTYLNYGFPLSWMVIGSGFWPGEEARLRATTSFGAWDKAKYPEPKKLTKYFHDQGLKVIIGLRIAFNPNGLYTQEGLENGYFIKKEGKARIFKVGFPRNQCYFLDSNNPEAVGWYIDLCEKWLSAGVDGFKEDLFGYETYDFDDDKVDAVNRALMDKGVYVMGRNGYLGSPMDLHRFEDFNYNHDQDRGPVVGLAFSYSGLPYTYPDIVGGTGLANKFEKLDADTLATYLMRNARYASVNPSMSFGFGVWELNNPQVLEVTLDAAKTHHALQPYIYDAAMKAYKTGFPYVLTPLPLSFSSDEAVFGRENNKIRGYQWMIGESLMATPLYGEDYAETDKRDVYLPDGKWIDYDNGKVYQGPLMLDDFQISVEKTPLFVGGNGFVAEQHNGKLYGRVYPTGFNGTITFTHKDGSVSEIEIQTSSEKHSTVRDLTQQRKVKTATVRHAVQFELLPAHDYSVQ